MIVFALALQFFNGLLVLKVLFLDVGDNLPQRLLNFGGMTGGGTRSLVQGKTHFQGVFRQADRFLQIGDLVVKVGDLLLKVGNCWGNVALLVVVLEEESSVLLKHSNYSVLCKLI